MIGERHKLLVLPGVVVRLSVFEPKAFTVVDPVPRDRPSSSDAEGLKEAAAQPE